MKKARLLALPSVMLLCACTVGPDFVAPVAKVPDTYAAPGDSALTGLRLVPGRSPDGEWWKQFHMPALDALVASALQDNPSVAAARARLAEAADERIAAEAALDLARRSFEAGNSGVLDVIDAERRSAEAQLGLSRATAQRLLDTVQLYVALGGTPIPVAASMAPQPGAACCSY